MAFPSSPTDGQTYTQFGRTFTYSSSLGAWRTFKNNDIATLGSITNLQLTGGENNQYIITDGAGHLSFTNLPISIDPFLLMGA
jgi:hypothetical protein